MCEPSAVFILFIYLFHLLFLYPRFMVSYRLDSDAGRNLLINLHQFVSKELSVLGGHDGLH